MTWLHTEAGYTFTGDDGIYALTYNEMRMLFDGYDVMQEQAEMQQRGVSRHEQSQFQQFAQEVNGGEWSPGGQPS